MEVDEYMKVPYKHSLLDIQKQYNLESKVTKSGHIFIKIKKRMYGLKQAAILVYNNMKKKLATHKYHSIIGTTGMWKHKTKKTKFCVCVNDFGIKYYSKEDADHLLDCLQEKYKYTTDMQGKNYGGFTFDWNYNEGYIF